MTSMRMTSADWGLLILLSVLWGGTFFFTGIAVKEVSVFTIVWCRVFLAALILHLVLRALGQKFPVNREVLLAFLGMGLLNNAIPFRLIVGGQREIASGLAAILNASTPLFTVLVAHFLTPDEKLQRHKVMGIFIGFAGVVIMVGGSALQQVGAQVIAQLMVLTAACTYAFAGIFGRRFKRMGVTPIATAAGQVTASSLILFPVMMVVDRPWMMASPSANAIGAIVAMAAFSTALAYIIYFRLLARVGATNLLLVTFLIPVTAIVLGSVRFCCPSTISACSRSLPDWRSSMAGFSPCGKSRADDTRRSLNRLCRLRLPFEAINRP
jgi:drug/metabolite transporter (DMT)-like permease